MCRVSYGRKSNKGSTFFMIYAPASETQSEGQAFRASFFIFSQIFCSPREILCSIASQWEERPMPSFSLVFPCMRNYRSADVLSGADRVECKAENRILGELVYRLYDPIKIGHYSSAHWASRFLNHSFSMRSLTDKSLISYLTQFRNEFRPQQSLFRNQDSILPPLLL